MIRHILVGESGTVLRAMLAGALADAVPAAGSCGGTRGGACGVRHSCCWIPEMATLWWHGSQAGRHRSGTM